MPEWVRQHLQQAGGENATLSGLVHCCLTRGMYSARRVPPRPDYWFDTFWWHTKPNSMPMGCRVFADGSLQDAPLGRHFAVPGWAFVVIDQGGNVMAAAHGVPPAWVNTIQGAELWAVQMVLSNVVFPQPCVH